MKLKKPKFWDNRNLSILTLILWPISVIFRIFANLKIKKKQSFKDIKTLCIGNFYIGGTGKTSLAIKIKEILEKKNIKVCFIKKYYSDQIDEQKLLEKNGKLFTHKKRVSALKKAILENYDLAIFDDGLQDKSINYDFNFVCFNSINWIGNGFVIPAGPLRENLKNLKYYKNVFLNGNNENLDNIKNEILNINSKIKIHESEYFSVNANQFDKNDKYIVFSGIGNHDSFIRMLKNEKFEILKDIEFPDHYNYNDFDLEKIFTISQKFNAKIITTEKDYLRIDKKKSTKIRFIKSSIKIKNENEIINILLNNNENN